jgi:hypothetical protein
VTMHAQKCGRNLSTREKRRSSGLSAHSSQRGAGSGSSSELVLSVVSVSY